MNTFQQNLWLSLPIPGFLIDPADGIAEVNPPPRGSSTPRRGRSATSPFSTRSPSTRPSTTPSGASAPTSRRSS